MVAKNGWNGILRNVGGHAFGNAEIRPKHTTFMFLFRDLVPGLENRALFAVQNLVSTGARILFPS